MDRRYGVKQGPDDGCRRAVDGHSLKRWQEIEKAMDEVYIQDNANEN